MSLTHSSILFGQRFSPYGEAIVLEALPGRLVAGRRRAVEQVQVVRSMLEDVAQHVDGAALEYLALQPRQEFALRDAGMASATSGWVARKKAPSCAPSTQYSRS